MTIRIVTDSACDLPPDLEEKHKIHIVALSVRFGADEFVDRKDLTPGQFWSKVKASAELPETAAPSPGAFLQAFEAAADDGCDGVVCINLSSDLSATMQSAQQAAKDFDRIPVAIVDSRSLTMGQGLMCLAAAEAAESGKSIDEVVAIVESLRTRVKVFAALDTLDNLKKGGRIGGAQAFLGSMLSIKPIIEVSSGKVESESKQRTRSRSLKYLADKVGEFDNVEQLAVMHGDAPDIEEFLSMLSGIYPRDDIIVGDLGAVIGTHGGPRTMGITFFTKE
ncbi:MAG: DegV family protein [Acidimicrobiales bacterium]